MKRLFLLVILSLFFVGPVFSYDQGLAKSYEQYFSSCSGKFPMQMWNFIKMKTAGFSCLSHRVNSSKAMDSVVFMNSARIFVETMQMIIANTIHPQKKALISILKPMKSC